MAHIAPPTRIYYKSKPTPYFPRAFPCHFNGLPHNLLVIDLYLSIEYLVFQDKHPRNKIKLKCFLVVSHMVDAHMCHCPTCTTCQNDGMTCQAS